MQLTITSKKLGRTLTFWKCSGPGYVYVDLNDQPAQQGKQICYGGDLFGNTVYTSDVQFESVVRRWYRSFLKKETTI